MVITDIKDAVMLNPIRLVDMQIKNYGLFHAVTKVPLLSYSSHIFWADLSQLIEPSSAIAFFAISSFTDEHFTDSELMFKIISDFYRNADENTKMIDKLTADMDSIERTGISIYSGMDSVSAALRKFIDK